MGEIKILDDVTATLIVASMVERRVAQGMKEDAAREQVRAAIQKEQEQMAEGRSTLEDKLKSEGEPGGYIEARLKAFSYQLELFIALSIAAGMLADRK